MRAPTTPTTGPSLARRTTKNVAATTITDTIDKADAVVVVTPYSVTYNGQRAYGDGDVDSPA
jgi:hypothetical protein